MRTRRLLLFFGVIVVGLLALGALAWPHSAWARAHMRASAEQRWAQRPFGRYYLDIKDKGCLQEIEVHNERVAGVKPNRCDAQPRSVGGLFELIRRDGSVSHPCIYQGCLCDDKIYISAVYHQELGYPTRIIVRIRAEPNWRQLEFWREALERRELPNCSGLSEGSKVIEIVDIIPIRSS